MSSLHPYVLNLEIGAARPHVTLWARLESPLLDPVVNPGRQMRVAIGNVRQRIVARDGFALDSFVLDSLNAYVENQQLVRRSLEHELARHRTLDLGKKTKGRDQAIWDHVKVTYLLIAPRNVLDVEVLRQQQWPAVEIERVVNQYDKPETKWSFILGVDVDWDDEHRTHTARFRDGVLVEIALEGEG